MIVFCEECGEKNIIDLEELEAGKEPRCKACNDILRYSIPHKLKQKLAKPKPPSQPEMEIRLGDQVILVSQTRPSVTMGRQEHNDIEVIDTRVSRSHARVEFRKGKFYIIDHSTNGTYVLVEGKQGINLKRGELHLEGNGVITLGRKVSPSSPKAIHFTTK